MRVLSTAIGMVLATATLLPMAVDAAQRPTRIPDNAMTVAGTLRETALASDLGYRITESLTTEVGPRMAGSEGDARAVAWAQAKFRELGYDKVW
ncbi:MAG: peptidase M28 family protein, partial [Lysobacter sp.]|nr:peptidase M28 family protein [Lysobacter sp.]